MLQYNFITQQLISVIFGRMLLREHSIEWWFVIPPLPTNVSVLSGEMLTCKNCIFSLACSISALPNSDWSLAYFIQSCYSQLMLLLLRVSLNLNVIRVKLWTILGPLPRKKGRWVFCTIAVGLCWKHKHQCTVLWKDKIAINGTLHSI